jgi:transposase
MVPEVVPKPSRVSDRRAVPPAPQEAAPKNEESVRSASQETVPSGTRRRFTASEKLRLINAADAALSSGERGALEALLRKEGIYSSHLHVWRKQLGAEGAEGLPPRAPGRKAKLDSKDRQLIAVTKENEALKHKLRVANALLALQKKARELLDLAIPEDEGT